MYYKEIRVWVPSEVVLDIRFLKHDKFFVYNFLNKPYITAAEIVGTRNFIGFGADGNIYLLDVENNRTVYASSALAVFARQLKLYRDRTAPAGQNGENETKNVVQDFSEQLLKLDNNAFSNENSFWSGVLKHMELDSIYEVKI